MAKKKANSFVLTIAGITAATVIGVVGVKLTPAPHVIFSLAPSAEPQATAEPEPIGCGLLLICWSLYFKKAAGRALCSI